MGESNAEAQPFRVLPAVTDTTAHFWHGGEHGDLCFLSCQDCGVLIHPPAPICPTCLSRDVQPTPVSGRGSVHAFTINHQPWYPTLDPPYVIAIVAIEEQPELRLTTNIFNCEPADVTIGMGVRVVFEQYEDVWLPMFEPTDEQIRSVGSHLATPSAGSTNDDA